MLQSTTSSVFSLTIDRPELDPESLSNRLVIAQSEDRVEVRKQPGADSRNLKLSYAIDVPYRTEVHALLRHGRQTITRIMGPVNAEVGDGTSIFLMSRWVLVPTCERTIWALKLWAAGSKPIPVWATLLVCAHPEGSMPKRRTGIFH